MSSRFICKRWRSPAQHLLNAPGLSQLERFDALHRVAKFEPESNPDTEQLPQCCSAIRRDLDRAATVIMPSSIRAISGVASR
jgi:hypothetical protein